MVVPGHTGLLSGQGPRLGPRLLPVPHWSAGGAPAPRNPCIPLQVGAGSLWSLSQSQLAQLVWLVWVLTAVEAGVGAGVRVCGTVGAGSGPAARSVCVCVGGARSSTLWVVVEVPWGRGSPWGPGDPVVGL